MEGGKMGTDGAVEGLGGSKSDCICRETKSS